MKCSRCQAINPAKARFCNACGAALPAGASAGAPHDYTPRHLAERILYFSHGIEGSASM